MDPRSSVVFYCGEQTGGSIEHAKCLLGYKVHELAGGSAGLFGLGNEGVYEVISGELISTVDLACAAVGKDSATGVSSTVVRTHSPPKPSGADADVGSLYSWGTGDMGELGLGPTYTLVKAPQKVRYDTSVAFTQVSCGKHHTCALDSRGNLYAWGQNFSRQLGLYTKKLENLQELRTVSTIEELLFSPRLVPMSLQRPIAKVACGGEFTVVLTKSGEIWSWGAGECGQLGTGRCTLRELPAKVELTPIPVENVSKPKKKTSHGGKKTEEPARKEVLVSDIACGEAHVLALSRKGALYAWGLNKHGQLGLTDTNTRFAPQEVPVSSTPSNDISTGAPCTSITLSKVYAFMNTSAGLDSHCSLWTWGSATNHRLLRPVHSDHQDAQSQRSASVDLRKTLGLQVLGSTIRAKSANGTQVSRKDLMSAPAVTFSAEPMKVTFFGPQKIAAFTFGSTGAAALVLTTLESLSPASGPLKGFSKLRIAGYGFWNSDKIIVKFSLVQAESGPSRSCTAHLHHGHLVCKPPKLTEPGLYAVTVSMDGGKTFLPQQLSLRAFKETHTDQIAPKMVDLRQTTSGVVTVTAKGLHLFEQDARDEDGQLLWPTEQDVVKHLVVKLLVSCSAPGATEPVLSEVTYPGRLLPLQALSFDSVINADGSVSQQGSIALDNDDGSLADGSSVDGGGSTTSVSHHIPDRLIECDVDFSSLGPQGSLIMIRGSFSINGQDFGTASPEFAPIICHSFSPSGAAPACCPAEDSCAVDGSVCSREINVLGSSFIPTAKLPAGMSIEAVVRVDTSVATGNKSPKRGNIIEKVISIHCDAADVITVAMPTIAELFSPGTVVPPKTPNADMDGENTTASRAVKSNAASGPIPEECTAQIFFRLIVPPPTVAPGKKPKTPTSPSKSRKEAPPLLSPEPVNIFLYKARALVMVPELPLVRRTGGRQLVVRGTDAVGGFPFRSSDVRVILFRKELGIFIEVPQQDTYMLGLDEDVPLPPEEPAVVPNDDEEDEEEELNEPAAGIDAAPVADLAAAVSMLSLDSTSLEPGYVSAQPSVASAAEEPLLASLHPSMAGSMSVAPAAKRTPSLVDHFNEPQRIVFVCPPICMPARVLPLEPAAAAMEPSLELSPEPAEGTQPAVTEQTGESEATYEPIVPLDFVYVSVLLDGRSAVEPAFDTHVGLFYKLDMSDRLVEVTGGAAITGARCVVHVDAGCVPSKQAIVRIRGESGNPVECRATIQTEPSATPTSVKRFFVQRAEQEEAARLAAERGPEPEKTAEESLAEAAAQEAAPSDESVPADGSPVEDPVKEPDGFLDVGGSEGSVAFELPSCADLIPVIDGGKKLLYVDVSVDGGDTWDTATEPLLIIK